LSCDYTFDPTHFMKFAEELKDNEDIFFKECNCKVKHCIYRTIISRSYYAAFLHAEQKIKKRYKKELEKVVGQQGSHKGVILLLEKIDRVSSTLLNGLKERREVADYDLDALIDEDSVNKSIETANEIINTLKKA